MGGGALQAESRTQHRTRFLFSFFGCLFENLIFLIPEVDRD